MTAPRVLVVRSGSNPFGQRVPGARVVEKVSHTIEPLDPPASAIPAAVDTTIFTSRSAVERVCGDDPVARRVRGAFAAGAVVAVGEATADALRERGFEPGIVAAGSGAAILDRLPIRLAGRTILLPRGRDAGADLPDALRSRGAEVFEAVVYRKRALPRDADLSREIVETPFRAFFPTAPSAARWLFDGASPAAAEVLRRTPAVALGPSTASALTDLGVRSITLSADARFDAAAELLERFATAAS